MHDKPTFVAKTVARNRETIMSTNDKTNLKINKQNKDEAIAEISAGEAEAIAGGMKAPPILSDPNGPMAPRTPPPLK